MPCHSMPLFSKKINLFLWRYHLFHVLYEGPDLDTVCGGALTELPFMARLACLDKNIFCDYRPIGSGTVG